jgi:hypothetical protein
MLAWLFLSGNTSDLLFLANFIAIFYIVSKLSSIPFIFLSIHLRSLINLQLPSWTAWINGLLGNTDANAGDPQVGMCLCITPVFD